jgi:tRNA1(Val) A37 N6-methylase TrmN6
MAKISFENELISQDFFYKGKVVVYQHKKGFRFSVDAPVLADFISPTVKGALEVGMGCGIISLLLIYRKKIPLIRGIEIQQGLKDLADLNIRENGFADKIQVALGDFRERYSNFKGVSLIFSNPPFFPHKNGRPSEIEEIRYARSDEKLSLKEFLPLAYRILRAEGSLYLILPCHRKIELEKIAMETGFYTRRLREICPYRDRKANRFLIQLTNYKVKTIKELPLILYKSEGCYSDEMEKIISG